MTIVWAICATFLLTAVSLTVYRLVSGPSTLDRLVAVDSIVAITICGLAVWTAMTGNTTIAAAIVALSLVSFIGSVSIARFRVEDDQ